MSCEKSYAAPDRLLICLEESCHGHFYLPLDLDEHIACPIAPEHRVAVYSGPILHQPVPEPEETHTP